MPTYEYECENCGHRFEQFQNMSEAPLKTCPECGQAVRRLIGTGAGIIFKGSGSSDNGRSATARGAGLGAGCDRARPCCGRDTPCDRSPRNSQS
ncbi:MAG: zinc ribbon domain-containing protein [Kiritimatiellae bacterium]|nr:zinc ribbon domain-containing protein [Kiritimatiellia bacterium]